MKVGFLAVAIVAGALAATSSLADQPPDAWYGAIDLGAHAREDAQTPSQIPELGYKPGSPRFQTFKEFAGFARVGYRVLPHLRLELEAGWRPAGMRQIVDEFQNGRPAGSITRICGDAVTADLSNCGAPNGGVGSWTGMANAVADFWLLGRPEPWIHPVAGLGIGFAQVHLQTDGRLFGVSGPLSPPSRIVIDDTDTRFAIQFFGGLAMRINDKWSADLTYRFLHSAPHTWDTTTTGAIKLGPISGKYEDHALTLGVRRTLGSPRPPPAMTGAEEFPFDRYGPTLDARSVTPGAGQLATGDQVSTTHAMAVGHTVTSGGFAYNMRLSERRAKATADQRVTDEVAESAPGVSWNDLTESAVQTGPGANAPLNQRAMIGVDF